MLRKRLFVLLFGAALVLQACQARDDSKILDHTSKNPADDAIALVNAANNTFLSVLSDDQVGANFQREFQNANLSGIIITPNLLKAGFVFGGAGGSGVLLARADNGEWSYPVFVQQGSGSFGLQIGFKSAAIVSIIGNRKQLETMLKGSAIAGGQVGGAVVDEGASIDYASGTDVSTFLKSFAVTTGAYIGADINLGRLWIYESLNHAFYDDPDATPSDIVLEARYKNPAADHLRNTLSRYYSGG